MFTVKKKPLTSNTIWDAENDRPLCRFVKGVFQTDDPAVAEQLKGLGYEVTGEADQPDSDGEPDAPDTQDQADSTDNADGGNGDAEPDADAKGTTAPSKGRRSRK
jgi:hypothetical protein